MFYTIGISTCEQIFIVLQKGHDDLGIKSI